MLLLPENPMLFSVFERYWDEPRALPCREYRATGKDALTIDNALHLDMMMGLCQEYQG